MAKFSPPPGTADIFPDEISAWYQLEREARKVFPLYGFGELRTPVFEYTEVFQKGIGGDTEVVQKEMYTFDDRGGRSLTLRPEGTAGVMRALAGTDVLNGNEKRVFYIGPMFRGERPAAGRRRQFHQVGVENAGRVEPGLDAECIMMLMHYLKSVGISDAKLLINTRGVDKDRVEAGKALKDYFAPQIDAMCDDCKERLERNIWRILDCKQECCQEIIENAPDFVSFFTEETRDYFNRVCDILTKSGVEFEIDKRLVRGLDYYVHTVFEVVHDSLGGQNAIAGGGRYEVPVPGNKKPIIGVGFAAGFERLLMVREALELPVDAAAKSAVYLVGLGDDALAYNMTLATELRNAGISAIAEVESKSMKAQMRTANRLDVRFTLISGDEELKKEVIICKDMEAGEQFEIPQEQVAACLAEKLGIS